MYRKETTILILIAIGIITIKADAQDAVPLVPPPANRGPQQATGARSADVNAIDAQFKSNDNFQVQQAQDDALGLLSDGKNDQKIAARIPGWLHDLTAQRRLDDVEQFALAAINAHPTDLRFIEACQQSRIRAKLLANKPQDALPLAKSLYDVCAMPDTSTAIDLISECLYDIDADGDPSGAVKKFKLEQIRGAAATQPVNVDQNSLARIQIDSSQYSSGLEKVELVDNGWDASMGKANLLLLAGRAKDASKVLKKAYALASDTNLAAATEAVARAMRAEDGTVGPANAWILSLRPPEQAAQ